MAKKQTDEGPAIFRNVPGRFAPGGPLVADYGITQSTFTLAVANQEYAIQGIATLSSIIIKARGGNVQLAFYEGQSNANYTLLVDGQSFELSVIPGGQIGKPTTFYVRSTTAGCIVEFIGLRLL